MGDTISDPYRLENMKKAYRNISDGNAPISDVKANHRYVRVLPADRDELNAIEADTNLLLFEYPLHYEIAVQGTYYHDPTVSDSTLTWLYGVVPMNYQFPVGTNEELIYYVYIPPTESKGDFYDKLEEEAYRVVGYEDEDGGAKANNASWIPSAYIKAWDDIADCQIPLEGVKVVANYVTKIGRGVTKANGKCEVDKNFTHKVHYRIVWESGFWDIRSGAIGQAYYNGPTQKYGWDLEIAKNGKSILYATVHRAAQKFYYGERLGLRRPNLSYGKTKIAVYDNNPSWGSGCCWGTWSLLGVIPDIVVARIHEAYTSFTYSTTIHELAHQSHLLFVGKGTYVQIAKEIHESWARAVECALTNHHYNVELADYGERCEKFNHALSSQKWYPENLGEGKTSCYTPIFWDLIDDFNQRNGGNGGFCPALSSLTLDYEFEGSGLYPNDVVSGYTIGFIQNNIMSNAYGLSSLSSSLKAHKISGVTNQMIDNHMAPYWNRNYKRP